MSIRDDGGPAYPGTEVQAPDGHCYPAPGMSLRDWFAGQALAGWLASLPADSNATPKPTAETSYQFADAMIAEKWRREADDE